MRAEPPVRRLSLVSRPRGRLLPVDGPVDWDRGRAGDPGGEGWTPEPDALWWSGDARSGSGVRDRRAPAAPGLPEPADDPVASGWWPDPATTADDLRDRSTVRAASPWADALAERLPVSWRVGGRAVPVRAALAAVAVAVALVLGLTAHRLTAPPESVTVPTARGSLGASGAPAGGTRGGQGPAAVAGAGAAGGATAVGAVPGAAAAGGVLVVDVEGRVRRPGLVRVPAGARVADAVAAAGGATAGAALIRINLARPLTDGEQVVVPGPHDPIPAGANGTGGGTAGAAGGQGTAAGAGQSPVDLNTATAAQLDTLPGVGPVLAGRIVQWRTEHGRFTSVDQLGEVSGIGDALLSRLRPLVRV